MRSFCPNVCLIPSPRLRGRVREGPDPRGEPKMADRSQRPKWHISEKLRSHARALRRDMTEAECVIWYNVRAHRFQGAGFRRQTPIGPYVVDFVCHVAKLIIEVDGGQHVESENIARDARRDAYLAAQGYRVLRFNNLDVMTNKSGVLDTIAAALGKSPLPNPPPQAGEGTRQAREQRRRSAGDREELP